MTARKSLRERSREALTGAEPASAEPTPAAPTDEVAPTKAAAAPAAAAGTRKSSGKPADRPGMRNIGVYLQRPTFDEARAAYMADLVNLAEGPGSLAQWVDAALHAYATLTTAERRAIAETLPSEERTESRGINRSFLVSEETVEAASNAIREDLREGWMHSRSELNVEAIQYAASQARARNGGTLPPAPARLANRPML